MLGTLIIRKTLLFILIFLVWYFLAFLTLGLVAEAEAPADVEKEISLPEGLPNFKVYAYKKVVQTWGADQWEYVDFIISSESSWDNEVKNPSSSAFGYFQFLNSTWKSVDCVKTADAYTQVDCGLKYIEKRYGNPHKAYLFWKANKWY